MNDNLQQIYLDLQLGLFKKAIARIDKGNILILEIKF